MQVCWIPGNRDLLIDGDRMFDEASFGHDRRQIEIVFGAQADENEHALVFDVADGGRQAAGTMIQAQPVGAHAVAAALDRQHIIAADKARYELRARFVVDVAGSADLLDAAAVHHHNHIGERHRLFLAVGDVDEGNAEFALQAF